MSEQQITSATPIQIVVAPPPEDEISLYELWNRVWRGRWIIAAVTVIALATAALYLSLSTTVYQSEAILQIGRVAGQPLENVNQLASKVYNAYRPINTVQAKRQLPRIHDASVDKAGDGLLALTTYGKSPKEAQDYLQSIIHDLLKQQSAVYSQVLRLHQDQLKALQTEYAALKVSGSNAAGNAQHVETPGTLQFMEQSLRLSTMATLLQQIAQAQNQLAPVNTYPSVVIRQPSYDPKAVSPKKLVILILALFGGLITGAFISLFWWAFRDRGASTH